ncbi:hypothetical protein EYF80_050727 [Liparis tanakae]|uniref:Uncharacterized protein n=1 Tax=Liparis tanakae TaxID=230148 RepID=A0A4Z2FFA3_9TELE|nr:hypothetical protein EYF80_050727 [Liparis tanakae]
MTPPTCDPAPRGEPRIVFVDFYFLQDDDEETSPSVTQHRGTPTPTRRGTEEELGGESERCLGVNRR